MTSQSEGANRPSALASWYRWEIGLIMSDVAGRRTSEHQRAERDARVVDAARRGVSTVEIAEAENISDRQVRRILSAADGLSPARETLAVRNPDVGTEPLVVDPFAIRADVIRAHLESLQALRALARTARQESVRVGAARTTVGVAVSLLALLERVGMAPPAAATWSSEEAWRATWTKLGEALLAAGVTDLAAFADDVARRVGQEVIGEEVELTGVGPMFDMKAAA